MGLGIGTALGKYGNFVFGTGSEAIGNAIKAERAAGTGVTRAIYRGFKTGINSSYSAQAAQGGYFKSVINAFKNIPAAWKSGSGWGKLSGITKACGKAMPALCAAMMILPEIPNVVKATKEQGIGQGLKETGKAAAKLTGGAIGAAIGSAFIPYVGSIVGWIAGSALTGLLVGKSYTEEQEEKAANGAAGTTANAQATQGNQNIPQFNGTAAVPTGSVMDLPDVDANMYNYRLPGGHMAYAQYSGNNNTVGSRLNIVSQ